MIDPPPLAGSGCKQPSVRSWDFSNSCAVFRRGVRPPAGKKDGSADGHCRLGSQDKSGIPARVGIWIKSKWFAGKAKKPKGFAASAQKMTAPVLYRCGCFVIVPPRIGRRMHTSVQAKMQTGAGTGRQSRRSFAAAFRAAPMPHRALPLRVRR